MDAIPETVPGGFRLAGDVRLLFGKTDFDIIARSIL